MKTKSYTATSIKNGQKLYRFGVFLLISGILLNMFYPVILEKNEWSSSSESEIALISMIWVCGIVLIIIGKKKMKGDNHKYVQNFFYHDNNTSIKQDVTSVMPDINFEAISRSDNLKQTYIKIETKTVSSDDFPMDFTDFTEFTDFPDFPDFPCPPQEKVVKCESCGAANVVTQGKVTECEYCGSYLQ